jgi:predicted Zn-dependent peptidase
LKQPAIIDRAFSNGISLTAEHVPSSALAAIALKFNAGSRRETPSNSGVTHFAEHMLFKGTQSRSSFDIASAFDRMGGYANAYTDKECVVVYCVVPADGALNALDIMLDMAFNSRFGGQEVEVEREVILSEIISSRDDAEEEALDRTAEAVWKKNSIALSVAGREESVSVLTRGKIYNWYKKYFALGEFSVFAAGNIDAAAFEKKLSRVSQRQKTAARFTTPAWNAGLHIIDSPFAQEQFFALFPFGGPVDEKRFYTLAVFNALAGDTMSSRLFRRLREQSGLCYTVFSYNVFFSDCGFWCVYVSASKKNLLPVARGVEKELLALQNGVSEDEIATAREHLCGEELISSEDMEYRMKRLMRNRVFGFAPRGTRETLALIRSVSKKDVEREIDFLLAPRPKSTRACVVYGPKLSPRARAELAKGT